MKLCYIRAFRHRFGVEPICNAVKLKWIKVVDLVVLDRCGVA